MKKIALALAGIVCLLAVAVWFLLNTAAGLRWTVGQVVARTGAQVEIGAVEGRLAGPVSLVNVTYSEPEGGTVVRIGDLGFDWKPLALLRGVLHVTNLEASGVEYVKKASTPSPEEEALVLPELSVPVEVQLDRVEVKSISITAGAANPVRIDLVSFRGSADEGSVALNDLRVEAPAYRVDEGRVRLGLGRDLPLDGSLNWMVRPEGMDRFEGALTVSGGLATTLKPLIEISEPFAARGEGTASALFSGPAWTLAVTVPEPVDLETIKAGWPAVSVSGTVSSDGDTGRANLRPEVSLSFQGNELRLTGEAALSAARLDVARGRLERAGDPGVVDFSGGLEFEKRTWTLNASVPEAVSLQTIDAGWPAVSVSGTVSSDGDTGRANLRPDLSLSFQGNGVLLTGEAALSAERLDVARARLEQVGDSGVVDFSGGLEFAERTWELEASIPEAVSLETIDAGWPAVSIKGSLSSRGDAGQAKVQPELSLSFQGEEALLTGDATLSSGRLDVAGAKLERSGSSDVVDFSGWLGFENALPFSVTGEWQGLHGPETAAWSSRQGEFEAGGDRNSLAASLSGVITPPGQGEESPVSLRLKADGLDKYPVVTGDAHLPYFAYGGVTAESLNADIDFQAAEGASSEISVMVAKIFYGERRADDLELRASGTRARHQASLTGRLDDRPIDAGVTGSYTGDRWQGQLQRLTVDLAKPEGTWRMDRPANVVWTPSLTEIEHLCLKRETVSACADGSLKEDGNWELAAELAELPLNWLIADAPESLLVEGAVSARARLASSGNGIEGEAKASIDQALVAWTGEEPVETRYRDLALGATLSPEQLRVDMSGRVDESGVLRGDLTLQEPFAEDGRIKGSVSAQLPSLRVLQAAAPNLGLKRGTANIELNVEGTRNRPRFGGQAQIMQAALDVPALGVELRELNLDVHSGDDQRLELDARAKTGDGSITADGFVAWQPSGDWSGEFKVRGDDAELVRLPQALVDGNPDLLISLDQAGGKVDGRIGITRAELTPEAARPQITISDDIVVLDGESPPPMTRNPMAWYTNITVDLGDKAHFKGYGVEGRLAGSLALDAPPRQPTRATGSIEILDGEYELYGTKFDIQRGQLVYAGGPIDNPGIDVQVGRELRDVSVTLAATGPLTDPDLKMTSTPPMSDTDRMSYLLLGRPASEASGAELGLLLRAATSLLPGGTRDVPGYIQSTLGLDTLELKADSAGEGASVELGEYLTPRLYVSYVSEFQQAVNVFRVHYDLAKHWLLRAESSTRESSGDLLLTW